MRSAESGAVVPALLDEALTAVETAQVELEQAQIALAYRSVEAVFDGFVGGTEVDPGDRINTSTLITTLDDRSYLLVSFGTGTSVLMVDGMSVNRIGGTALGGGIGRGARAAPGSRDSAESPGVDLAWLRQPVPASLARASSIINASAKNLLAQLGNSNME